MGDDLEVVETTRDHAIATWRTVTFYVWRAGATTRGAGLFRDTVGRIRAARPGGPGVLLGVVEAGTPPPDGPTRQALADGLSRGSGYVQASALVFEGDGFQASMARAVATGLALIARPAFPHQVFASVDAGSDWLEGRVRVGAAPAYAGKDLRSMLRAVRDAPFV